jgi:hypothetical protein
VIILVDIKKEIKSSGLSMRKVALLLNEKYGKGTVQNLSAKIKRGTLKYYEAESIANIIGKNIEWVDKSKNSEEN